MIQVTLIPLFFTDKKAEAQGKYIPEEARD